MELKGSKTEKNLMTAFAGESMARNKYTYFASTAKKEGYEQISAIFLETANNEKEHAKLWFKLLDGIGNTMESCGAHDAGVCGEKSGRRPRFFFLPESGCGYDAARGGTAGADLKGYPHISFWHALDDG